MMEDNEDRANMNELSEALNSASSAIDDEARAKQQIAEAEAIASVRRAENRHVYSTATNELARALQNQAQTLERLLAEDEEELRIIEARRANRWEAHEAIMRTLAGLQV